MTEEIYWLINLEIRSEHRTEEVEERRKEKYAIERAMGKIGKIASDAGSLIVYHIGDSTVTYNLSFFPNSKLFLISSDEKRGKRDLETLLGAIQEESPEIANTLYKLIKGGYRRAFPRVESPA